MTGVELIKLLSAVEIVYIFGAGAYGRTLYEKLEGYQFQIEFCDNDTEKIGSIFCG